MTMKTLRLPLEPPALVSLSGYIEGRLVAEPCNGDLHHATDWALAREFDPAPLLAWLNANGAGCDCEIMINSEGLQHATMAHTPHRPLQRRPAGRPRFVTIGSNTRPEASGPEPAICSHCERTYYPDGPMIWVWPGDPDALEQSEPARPLCPYCVPEDVLDVWLLAAREDYLEPDLVANVRLWLDGALDGPGLDASIWGAVEL